MFKFTQRLASCHLRNTAAFSTEQMGRLHLYYIPFSPPCRAVIMAAKLLEVHINLKYTNLFKDEHKTPEFLKMNSQHTVPVLDDDGFVLYESRAIMRYLANKYGKDDSLYPKDPQKRALVDQALDFDMNTFYQPFIDYWYYCMLGPAPHDEERFQKVPKSFPIFDDMLKKSDFVTGQNISLADISLLAGVSSVNAVGFDITNHPNIVRWFASCKQAVPDYQELNEKGVQDFKKLWDRFKEKQKTKVKTNS
ncbi:glutathione S-transferase 1 isoform X1 [Bemisia tabaci]|uniref:glutathione S-transferase 1 isoform X1 n=1 Tax=Bemisia tabaci TaxID=7038 RepID=UPI003B28867F